MRHDPKGLARSWKLAKHTPSAAKRVDVGVAMSDPYSQLRADVVSTSTAR
jgi:hypothetical protein